MAEKKEPPKFPFLNAEMLEGAATLPPISDLEFKVYMIRIVERLQTQMKTLLGNGRPGSIERLSGRLRKVEMKCAASGNCASRKRKRT